MQQESNLLGNYVIESNLSYLKSVEMIGVLRGRGIESNVMCGGVWAFAETLNQVETIHAIAKSYGGRASRGNTSTSAEMTLQSHIQDRRRDDW